MSNIGKVGKILSLVMGVCASMPQVGANPTSVLKERKRSKSVNVPFKRSLVEVKGGPQGQKVVGPNLSDKNKSQTGKVSAPKSLVTLVPGRKGSKMSTGRILGYASGGILLCVGGVYVVYGLASNGDWRLKRVFRKKGKVSVEQFESVNAIHINNCLSKLLHGKDNIKSGNNIGSNRTNKINAKISGSSYDELLDVGLDSDDEEKLDSDDEEKLDGDDEEKLDGDV